MKIALVTPWPGDRSGIADYAYSLADGLHGERAHVTVFTQSDQPTPLAGVALVNSDYRRWNLDEHDLVVYHFGNNIHFHGHMLDLLEKFPGVIHLHDYVLQHLLAGQAFQRGQWPSYVKEVTRFYGPEVGKQAEAGIGTSLPFWERDDILQYPLCESILEKGVAFIVHSQFAFEQIRRRLPWLPGIVVPQTYPDTSVADAARDPNEFHIGVFGHVQPNRCIDVLLKALCDVDAGDRRIAIHVVGPQLDAAYQDTLQGLLSSLAGKVRFDVVGFASSERFLQEMASCDVCISLRYPTLGETSAVVTRAMKFGKPIVVTRVGWYAELPDCIAKIDPGPSGVGELTTLLNRMVRDETYVRQLRAATLRFAKQEYDFHRSASRYHRALHEFYHIQRARPDTKIDRYFMVDPLVNVFRELGLDNVDDEAGLREWTYRKLAGVLGDDAS